MRTASAGPGAVPDPALGKPAGQSVTVPPQLWFLNVARAWILSAPGRLAMTFRTVNEPLAPEVVACRETTTAPLSVIRTAHTCPARFESTGFLAAARELTVQGARKDLADDQPADRASPSAAVREAGSLDLAKERIGTIIWATGYAYDLGWVKAPALDTAGRPLQRRGVTQVPGLYFLGLHWMHTIKSGLLSGVGNDAECLAEHIAGTH